VAAFCFDMHCSRIPNPLFVGGVLLSQVWLLVNDTLIRATQGMIGAMIVMLILFPVFMIGGIGAGDIKLLMISPMYFSFKDTLMVILLTFIISAVAGTIKLIQKKAFGPRLINLIQYIESAILYRRLFIYDRFGKQENGYLNSHRIHLSLPILLSVVIIQGGSYF